MSLSDRWLAWRNGLLSDPAFQRLSSSIPFVRIIARRRAKALFDICAGFIYSQVLRACVELNLFETLAQGPQPLDELAGRLSLSRDAARRLLDAAAALDLVCKRRDGRYGLGMLGAALRGNPAISRMVEHHALLYSDLADPVAMLRGQSKASRIAGFWPYARADDPRSLSAHDVEPYGALMAGSQAMFAADVLEAYPFARHRQMLDVGGGEGAFAIAAAKRFPDLRLRLLDLPAVAKRARIRIGEASLSDRIEAIGGDFLGCELPPGADLITLVRVLHDHDDKAAATILARAYRALAPGGTLLIAEPMAETHGAETVGAYFQLYLLAMGSGRPRSRSELGGMLKAVGFARYRTVPTNQPLLVSMLAAEKSDLNL